MIQFFEHVLLRHSPGSNILTRNGVKSSPPDMTLGLQLHEVSKVMGVQIIQVIRPKLRVETYS